MTSVSTLELNNQILFPEAIEGGEDVSTNELSHEKETLEEPRKTIGKEFSTQALMDMILALVSDFNELKLQVTRSNSEMASANAENKMAAAEQRVEGARKALTMSVAGLATNMGMSGVAVKTNANSQKLGDVASEKSRIALDMSQSAGRTIDSIGDLRKAQSEQDGAIIDANAELVDFTSQMVKSLLEQVLKSVDSLNKIADSLVTYERGYYK